MNKERKVSVLICVLRHRRTGSPRLCLSDKTEIRNKESLGGLITEENADGSPVQEVMQGR